MSEKRGKFDGWLNSGGQKQMRLAGHAELYDVEGPKRLRSSAAGFKTTVTGILDPKLDLTPQERAVGNCYGAYFEQAYTGGSAEFLREFVDSGNAGGGGYSEKQAHIVAMVLEAQAALSKAKTLRYKMPKTRQPGSKIKRARHLPIQALTLMDAVCVHGHTVTAVAIRFQWFTYSGKKTDKGSIKAPWRQRQAISLAIRDCIKTVDEAWDKAGMAVPFEFGAIEVD